MLTFDSVFKFDSNKFILDYTLCVYINEKNHLFYCHNLNFASIIKFNKNFLFFTIFPNTYIERVR